MYYRKYFFCLWNSIVDTLYTDNYSVDKAMATANIYRYLQKNLHLYVLIYSAFSLYI